MSIHPADSKLSFELPKMSYVDAQWEEPTLHAASTTARQGVLAGWLSRQVAAFVAWRRDREAATALASMTDRELLDIGLSRVDVTRVFDRAYNEDLRRRGA
jgi:uncharacterized protein YjiS (DUF1127 family)